MPQFILKISRPEEEVVAAQDVCCYLLSTSLGEEYIRRFDCRGKLLLLEGEKAAELCRALKADGVVLAADLKKPLKAPLLKIREQLGKKAVIGVVIPPRRHEAMLVSETEPEFIAFREEGDLSAAKEVVDWYNELFLIQSAWYPTEENPTQPFPETDFVILNPANYKILVAKK